MNLWQWLKSLVTKEAQHAICIAIDPAHDDTPGAGQPIVAGTHYIRLWLAEMFLDTNAKWFTEYYPVTHTVVKFQFGDQEVEIPSIAGPGSLKDVDPAHLNTIIPLNHKLTTLLPFNGGTVEILSGLHAMQGENQLKSFLGVMEQLSGLLQVPQLSAALAVAGPVATGIQTLLSAGSSGLRLGVHQAFADAAGAAAPTARSGYLLAMQATEAQVNPKELWVRDGRLRRGKTAENSIPMTGFPYMLVRIETRPDRDDWDQLASIAGPRMEALDALGAGDTHRADTLLRAAIVATLKSKDLTREDRKTVVRALKAEFDVQKTQLGLGAAPSPRPKLGALVAATAPDARDIDLEELFA